MSTKDIPHVTVEFQENKNTPVVLHEAIVKALALRSRFRKLDCSIAEVDDALGHYNWTIDGTTARKLNGRVQGFVFTTLWASDMVESDYDKYSTDRLRIECVLPDYHPLSLRTTFASVVSFFKGKTEE